eukprot:395-Pyramimonas_sp.AAC.2
MGKLGILKITTLTMDVLIVCRERMTLETLTMCNQFTLQILNRETGAFMSDADVIWKEPFKASI